MIRAAEFCDPARERGFRFWTGVPCSYLSPFINHVIDSDELDYIGATSEGEAIGLAAGAQLAGVGAVVQCQNSGLGNAINPLTSLCHPFRIPILLIVTHRGAPALDDEPDDEPQHELMGEITIGLLETLGIDWAPFPEKAEEIAPTLDRAVAGMASTGLPYALVMPKGALAPRALNARARTAPTRPAVATGKFSRAVGERMSRTTAIEIVRSAVAGEHPLLATTGKAGRELFSLGDADNQFYMVGSMGCAPAIALGLHRALRKQGRGYPVSVIDGDAAALMKMGTFATVGHEAPRGLAHILLDNEVHDSTGGQATVSAGVDFAGIAIACGYAVAERIDDPDDLRLALKRHRNADGAVLLHVKVGSGADPDLGRPALAPVAVKERLQAWLART